MAKRKLTPGIASICKHCRRDIVVDRHGYWDHTEVMKPLHFAEPAEEVIDRKPSRQELLKVIGKLQSLVGSAKADYMNDRGTDRYEKVVGQLEEAHRLCVNARSFDDTD